MKERGNGSVSPKTPGGISKSLLTPCRRVGLSRKWKNSSRSTFTSPLTAKNTTPEGDEDKETKKRKRCEKSEVLQDINVTPNEESDACDPNKGTPQSSNNSNMTSNIITTPCRNTPILPRRKSKTLVLLKDSQESEKEELVSANKSTSNNTSKVIQSKVRNDDKCTKKDVCTENNTLINDKVLTLVKEHSGESISKPVRTESKSKIKLSLKKSQSKSNYKTETRKPDSKCSNTGEIPKPKVKSPNNLTKECIVVIQNKIFKTDAGILVDHKAVPVSQEFDSDLDIPLSALKKESNDKVTLNTLNEDDFLCKPIRKKIRNLSIIKPVRTSPNPSESSNTSQSSQEDIHKNTILKKTYDKVTKPSKAKSTGSITQKDIDDLKAQIAMKKNLLLAQAMSTDTEELRGLIKKWQKGCQDALMELLELMKKKLPDQQNMDYAEMLQSLKIPAELVGYDPENDCFVTPDDTNILLSTFKL